MARNHVAPADGGRSLNHDRRRPHHVDARRAVDDGIRTHGDVPIRHQDLRRDGARGVLAAKCRGPRAIVRTISPAVGGREELETGV